MKIFYSEKDEQRRETLIEANAASNARALALGEANKVLQVQLDFMRHRVNQLELERAVLLNAKAGVQMPVPELVPTSKQLDVRELLQAMPSFEDVGDDEAAKLGIRLDPSTGEVIYASDKKE